MKITLRVDTKSKLKLLDLLAYLIQKFLLVKKIYSEGIESRRKSGQYAEREIQGKKCFARNIWVHIFYAVAPGKLSVSSSEPLMKSPVDTPVDINI